MPEADRLYAASLRVAPSHCETRAGAGRHHLGCRRCGEITEVTCTASHPPGVPPAAGAGFVIDEAEVTFWGLCPRCQPAAARDHTF